MRYFHPMWSRGVRMPERATGRDAVADELLDLLDFRKAPTLLPRPDDLVINAHLKDATGPIGGERHRAEFLGKRGQQLLRHPARPQAPAAQSAIGDLDHGADGHSCLRVQSVGAPVSTSNDDKNSPARKFHRPANVALVQNETLITSKCCPLCSPRLRCKSHCGEAANGFSNQRCVLTPDFESILHARMGKIVLQHNPSKSDRIDASQRTNVKYHERTSEMVRPGSMNELGTSSAEIIHRLHFISTELADEAYAPRSARHWRVQGSSPCERRPDRHA